MRSLNFNSRFNQLVFPVTKHGISEQRKAQNVQPINQLNNIFYIPTAPCLQNVVHSFWQTDRTPTFEKEIIIPRGIVEIIFNFSENSIHSTLNGKQYKLPRCVITGFNTFPVEIQLPLRQHFFGVRFYPSAIKQLFSAPSFEFTNLIIDLTLINHSLEPLWHQLIEQANFYERVAIFTKWVQDKTVTIHQRQKLLDDFLYDTHHQELSVSQLSAVACYSPRHLSRKLLELTGMNTEEILLYKKFLRSCDLIHFTSLSLTAIAHRSGFSDQSHFIKVFKQFAEMTPGQYKQQKSGLSGHIFQNVR
jgi:AraC-like DNA-binding protein